MVIVVDPMYSGMAGVTQLSVPLANPEAPVELAQVTALTPTLSCAVPLTITELADVDTLVVDGATIAREGGVVSGPAGVLVCWRVMVKF